MSDKSRVLLVSRSGSAVSTLQDCFVGHDQYQVETAMLVNGHHDPLQGVEPLPDVLVLRLNEQSSRELQELIARPAHRRAPLIVVGGEHDTECMRLAMQAGARDFLKEPVIPEELLSAVASVVSDGLPVEEDNGHQLTTFINAKGGSGASFLSAGYAHICQVVHGLDTVLVDMDRQFAAIPQYLDMKPGASLFDALRVVDELDIVAINAFAAKHSSGLSVMAGCQAESASEPEQELALENESVVPALLDVLDQRFDRIVAEVPRHLDVLGAAVLRNSSRIVMVVQQSVPSIRDAARLKGILCSELGLESGRIKILVNRYQPELGMELKDIKGALGADDVFTVPNDFKAVSESVDTGVPIYELARKSPVSTALVKLSNYLTGTEQAESKGFLSRSLSAILRN